MLDKPLWVSKVDEVWIELAHEGRAPVLRIGVNAADMPVGSELDGRTPLSVCLGSKAGVAGSIRFVYVGTFKGQAIFEASELCPASDPWRAPAPGWLVSTWPPKGA